MVHSPAQASFFQSSTGTTLFFAWLATVVYSLRVEEDIRTAEGTVYRSLVHLGGGPALVRLPAAAGGAAAGPLLQ